MKRLSIFFAAALLFFSAVTASAEGFLIKGGVTLSNIASSSLKDFSVVDLNNYTGWHAGIGYQTASVGGFSFQPELLFNVKGTKINGSNDLKWKMSYIELPINIQWGIDLLVAKPFVFASPFVGYNIANKQPGVSIFDASIKSKPFEYGLGVGFGLNIFHIQLTAKYSWDFGAVVSLEEYANAIRNVRNTTGCWEISGAIVF